MGSKILRLGIGLTFICLFAAGCCSLCGGGGSDIGAPIRVEDYPEAIRVACVGDSITAGSRLEKKYPDQLGELLGEKWDVRNFGKGGATLLKNQPGRSYWDHPHFGQATEFEPDVVVIALGTNDSKPAHWDEFGKHFEADYLAMVEHFRALPSKPRIWICYPPPAFSERFEIRDSVIKKEIIPIIDRVALEKSVPVIDLYSAMNDPAIYYDTIHPNEEGAGRMAKAIAKALTGE